jgi:DNA-binding transcriptional LysR family regulator
VARGDHPIATKAVVAPEDLRDERLLHRPDCAAAAALRAHVDGAGVALRPAPAFATDDDVIRYLIATGSIAFLPTRARLCERLVRRRLDGPDFGYDLHVTTVGGRLRGPALSLFLTQMRAAAWSAEAT